MRIAWGEPVDLREAPLLAEVALELRWLRVSGFSMHPTLSRGDRIEVDGKSHPVWGDVVVVRTPSGLLCHRVISTTAAGLRTRGDANGGTEEEHTPEAFVGVVTRVERDGRWEALPASKGTGWRQEVRLVLARATERLRAGAGRVAAFSQSFKPYRRLVRALARPWLRTRALTPIRRGLFFRSFSLEKPSGPFPSWIRLRVDLAGRCVGQLDLHSGNGDVRMIGNTWVRPMFRGLGVGERLVREAVALGMSTGCVLRCHVDPGNVVSRRLFASMGFVETATESGCLVLERRWLP